MKREEMHSYGWGLVTAALIVALSWVLVALAGSTANPGILLGPVLLGAVFMWQGRPR